MKAIQFSETGGPEVLEYVDLPDPTAGPGEVLVKAQAFGVGKPDVLLRSGVYKWMPPLPAVIGNEMTGHVVGVGAGVSHLALGQAVLVFGTGGGRHAEMNAVPADIVTALPGGVDLDAAVCIPNYAIAWCLLKEACAGTDVKSVYVNGAAGGVGSAVIDLCRLEGIEVIAGASSDAKCAFASDIGATHTINYGSENVVERVLALTDDRGVDLVLDQLIGPDFTDNLQMLAPLGMILSFNALAGLPEKELFAEMRAHLGKSPAVRCFSWHSYDANPDARARVLGEVVDRFADGGLTPPIHATLPLADARKAHEMLDARDILGKVILKP
ncbi:MAG: zinc-binding dehydrogenase [Rhodospirillaceae bacterium]|jgi:NADPH2:quinone reductase|nr:zinc-binding dehydrogenase [Rhodospirillaceae bacterium]